MQQRRFFLLRGGVFQDVYDKSIVFATVECFFIDTKTLMELLSKSHHVFIDQLYDKFSIKKPIEFIIITKN